MQQVHDLPAMHVNPGFANSKDWQSVAYIGGFEPGVLNLTSIVTARGGTTYCVSATWNNAALLDELRCESLYGSLLRELRQRGESDDNECDRGGRDRAIKSGSDDGGSCG